MGVSQDDTGTLGVQTLNPIIRGIKAGYSDFGPLLISPCASKNGEKSL